MLPKLLKLRCLWFHRIRPPSPTIKNEIKHGDRARLHPADLYSFSSSAYFSLYSIRELLIVLLWWQWLSCLQCSILLSKVLLKSVIIILTVFKCVTMVSKFLRKIIRSVFSSVVWQGDGLWVKEKERGESDKSKRDWEIGRWDRDRFCRWEREWETERLCTIPYELVSERITQRS